MQEYPELNEILNLIEGRLSNFSVELNRAKRISGKEVIDRILDKGDGGVNVIPGGNPGRCRGTLVVAIGTNEGIERRILEAIEHVGVSCRGINKNVIFIAFNWNYGAWLRHEGSFRALSLTVHLFVPPNPAPTRLA